MNLKNMNTTLPAEVERREQIMGEFTAALAKHLPEDLRTPVAFCSPASFREPEIDTCWHSYMIRRGLFLFIFDQLPKFLRAWASGVRRFMRGHFGSWNFKPREGATVLGITPRSICKVQDGRVETNYCYPEDVAQMSWLIIDEAGKEAGGYPVSKWRVAVTFLQVLYVWVRVSCLRRRITKDWLVASVITFRWIFGFQWVIQWMWSLKLRSLLSSVRPSKVHAVHETWPWARIVWQEAARLGIRTSTIQHASIVRSKLWYFPSREEREVGIALPDEFFVFSQKNEDLLRPFYPRTRFVVSCGPRYAHWKERAALPSPTNTAPLLFTTSLPWWDNEVVLQGLYRLVQTGSVRPIRVRFHPCAVISNRWKRWLTHTVAKGSVTISDGTFQDDVMNAGAVIGLNTTVLEEAMAMGRPAIVLHTDQYLSFGTGLGFHLSPTELTRENIEQVIVQAGSSRDTLIAQGRKALGLDQLVAHVTL